MRTVSATKNRILLYGLDWFTEQHDAGMVCVKGNVRYRDAVYEGAAFCRLVASAAADAGAFGAAKRRMIASKPSLWYTDTKAVFILFDSDIAIIF